MKNWKSGQFQSAWEGYLNEHIGFSNFLVRLYNQIQFNLFSKSNAIGVIVGKNNYLYEKGYIDAYFGKNYSGKKYITEKINRLKRIQEYLSTNNTDLIVCLAPGKASYFPEYIPDELNDNITDSTEYHEFKKQAVEQGIKVVDFSKWFDDQKDTTTYPLYPQYGIHWSQYGIIKATDSLVKYLEKLKGVDLPNIEISEINWSDSLQGTDYDIGSSLNLFFGLKTFPMAYPKYSWDSTVSRKLNGLVIADSYFWGIFLTDIFNQCFTKGDFWYYYQTDWPAAIDVANLDLMEEVKQRDFIILLASEISLNRLPYGFEEDLSFFINQNKEIGITYNDSDLFKQGNEVVWYNQENLQPFYLDTKRIVSELSDSSNFSLTFIKKLDQNYLKNYKYMQMNFDVLGLNTFDNIQGVISFYNQKGEIVLWRYVDLADTPPGTWTNRKIAVKIPDSNTVNEVRCFVWGKEIQNAQKIWVDNITVNFFE